MDADGSAASCSSAPEEQPLQQPITAPADNGEADSKTETTTVASTPASAAAAPAPAPAPLGDVLSKADTPETAPATTEEESGSSSTASATAKRKLPANVDEHGNAVSPADAVENNDAVDVQKVPKRSRLLLTTTDDSTSGNADASEGIEQNGGKDDAAGEQEDDDFDEDDDEEFEIERQRRKVSASQGFPKGYESDVHDSFDEDATSGGGGGGNELPTSAEPPSGSQPPPLSLSDILPDVAAGVAGVADFADADDADEAARVAMSNADAALASPTLDDDDLAKQMLQDVSNPQARRRRRRRRQQRPADSSAAGTSAETGPDGDADPNEGDGEVDDGDVDMDYELTQKLKDMGEISVSKADGKHKARGQADYEADQGDEVSLELAAKGGSDVDTEDKRKITNLRKNIREVMDDNQLDASTLAAQRQELDRLARVQEQQRQIRDAQRQIAMERQNSKMQNRVLSLLQGKSTSLLKGLSDGDATAMAGASGSAGADATAAAAAAAVSAAAASSADGCTNRTVNLTPSVSIAAVRSGASATGLSMAKRDPLAIDSSPEATAAAGADGFIDAATALRLAGDETSSSSGSRAQPSEHSESKLAEAFALDASAKPSASSASTATIIDDDDDDMDDMDDDGLDDDDLDDGLDDEIGIDAPAMASGTAAAAAKKDVVHIVDSSDDDCIMLSDDEDEQDDTDDPQNSGLHVNDAYNVPDEQGGIVVNIGHPEGEEDIFVAPQIARIMKPHQIGGVRFLFDNIIESVDRFASSTGFGCILAHSMGLGKTLQLVCFCDIFLRHTEAKTVLCIMPINTLQNWMAEFNMWLPEEADKLTSRAGAGGGEVRPRNFNLFVLNDTHKTLQARARIVLEWSKNGGVLLMGYELYRLLSMKKVTKKRGRKGARNAELEQEQNEAHKQLLDEMHAALVKPGPDLCVCDEGHRIKNSHAGISVALKQMRSKRRIVLTGYPLQNNLLEYWCMVDFVRPNYLGTRTEFSNMFERPILNGQCIDSTPQDIKLMRYRAHVLHSLLLGFVQRRSHVVLQNSLPQKEEFVLMVRMTEFQRRLYEVFMNEVVRTKAVPNPLKAFAVCCKIWNHPDVLYNFLKKREADLDLEEAEAAAADPSYEPESPQSLKATPAAATKKKEKETKKSKAVAAAAAAAATAAATAAAASAAAAAKAIKTPETEQVPTAVQSIADKKSDLQKTEQTAEIATKSAEAQLNEKFDPKAQNSQQLHHQQQQQQQTPHNVPYNHYPDHYGQYNSYDGLNNYYNNYNNYPNNAAYPGHYGQGYGQHQPPYHSSNNSAYPGQAADYWHQSNANHGYYHPHHGDYNQHAHQQQHSNQAYNSNYPHAYGQPNQAQNYNNHTPNAYNYTHPTYPTLHNEQQPAQQQQHQQMPTNPWSSGAQTMPTKSTDTLSNGNGAGAGTDTKPESKFVDMDTKEINLDQNPLSMNLDIAKIEDKANVKTEPAAVTMAAPANSASADAMVKNEIKKEDTTTTASSADKDSSTNTTSSATTSTTTTSATSTTTTTSTTSSTTTTPTTSAATPTSSAAAATTPAKGAKDDGIPYEWAVELMKNYVPDLISNSPKMEIFFCILEESLRLKDRMLVFSQSLLTLSLIEKFLQANTVTGTEQHWARNVNYYRLDGSTAAMEREKLINEFNVNQNVHLFLVSTRAGSLGINLVGANRVVVFDASWNPCHDTQAVCRVYRYGQQKPCFVYRLVMDSCLEKKIYDRQVNKQGMSDRVVDESNPDAHLSMKEVTNLCYDDEKETEVKDFSDCLEKYKDVAARQIICKFSSLMTKEPFQHETLLIDRKEKKLSMAEKRLAQRGYELEKQAALKPQGFIAPGTVSGVGQQQYRAVRRPDGVIVHRPVASVRPMQAGGGGDGMRTIVGTGLGGAGVGGITRQTRWIPAEVWQRQGMTAQVLTLPGDVVIPTSSAEKSSIVLKEGQKVMVLKSPKGIYMQLESGKIIAIRTAFKMGGQSKEKTVTTTGATTTPSGLLGRDFTPRPRQQQPALMGATKTALGAVGGADAAGTTSGATSLVPKNTVRPFGATTNAATNPNARHPTSLLGPKGRGDGPTGAGKAVQLGTARPYNHNQTDRLGGMSSSLSSSSNSSSSFDAADGKSNHPTHLQLQQQQEPIAIIDDDVTEVDSDSDEPDSESMYITADGQKERLEPGEIPRNHPLASAAAKQHQLRQQQKQHTATTASASTTKHKDDDVIMLPAASSATKHKPTDPTPPAAAGQTVKPAAEPTAIVAASAATWNASAAKLPNASAASQQYAVPPQSTVTHQPTYPAQTYPYEYGAGGKPDAGALAKPAPSASSASLYPHQHNQQQPLPYAPPYSQQSQIASSSYGYPERKNQSGPSTLPSAGPTKPASAASHANDLLDVQPLREKIVYKPNLVERKPRAGSVAKMPSATPPQASAESKPTADMNQSYSSSQVNNPTAEIPKPPAHIPFQPHKFAEQHSDGTSSQSGVASAAGSVPPSDSTAPPAAVHLHQPYLMDRGAGSSLDTQRYSQQQQQQQQQHQHHQQQQQLPQQSQTQQQYYQHQHQQLQHSQQNQQQPQQHSAMYNAYPNSSLPFHPQQQHPQQQLQHQAPPSPHQSHSNQQHHQQQQQQHNQLSTPISPKSSSSNSSLKNYRHKNNKNSSVEPTSQPMPPSAVMPAIDYNQPLPPHPPQPSMHPTAAATTAAAAASHHHNSHAQQQYHQHGLYPAPSMSHHNQHHPSSVTGGASDSMPLRYGPHPPAASAPLPPHMLVSTPPYGLDSGPGPSSLSFLERTASSIHERPSAFNSTLNDITRPPVALDQSAGHSSSSNSSSTSPLASNHHHHSGSGAMSASSTAAPGPNNPSNNSTSTPKAKPKSRAPKKSSAATAKTTAPVPAAQQSYGGVGADAKLFTPLGKEKPPSKASAKKALAAAKLQSNAIGDGGSAASVAPQPSSSQHGQQTTAAAAAAAVLVPTPMAPSIDTYNPYNYAQTQPPQAPQQHLQQHPPHQPPAVGSQLQPPQTQYHQQSSHQYQAPSVPQQQQAQSSAVASSTALHQPYATASATQPQQVTEPQHVTTPAATAAAGAAATATPYGNYPPHQYGGAYGASPSDPYAAQQQQQQQQQQHHHSHPQHVSQHHHQPTGVPAQSVHHHGYDAYNMGYPPYQQQPQQQAPQFEPQPSYPPAHVAAPHPPSSAPTEQHHVDNNAHSVHPQQQPQAATHPSDLYGVYSSSYPQHHQHPAPPPAQSQPQQHVPQQSNSRSHSGTNDYPHHGGYPTAGPPQTQPPAIPAPSATAPAIPAPSASVQQQQQQQQPQPSSISSPYAGYGPSTMPNIASGYIPPTVQPLPIPYNTTPVQPAAVPPTPAPIAALNNHHQAYGVRSPSLNTYNPTAAAPVPIAAAPDNLPTEIPTNASAIDQHHHHQHQHHQVHAAGAAATAYAGGYYHPAHGPQHNYVPPVPQQQQQQQQQQQAPPSGAMTAAHPSVYQPQSYGMHHQPNHW